ncbi:unnamed protein product, partial [Closterium sp. Naga37s-1]
ISGACLSNSLTKDATPAKPTTSRSPIESTHLRESSSLPHSCSIPLDTVLLLCHKVSPPQHAPPFPVRATKMRIQRATRVRRGRRYRILGPMIWDWVDDIMRDWGCVEGGDDEQTSAVQDASSQPPHAPDTPVVLRRTQATAVGDDTPTPDSTPRKRRRTGETSRPLAQRAIF